jgi:hypothetical protein
MAVFAGARRRKEARLKGGRYETFAAEGERG